jgi:hypothetical protein
MNTPRIRSDLQATATEEAGIRYFDVSDPRSGARMRLYDFEWLIAERMDGRRAFDEVASWARERLGIAPSAGDLEDYARRLGEYGFFEGDGDGSELRASADERTLMAPVSSLSAGGGNGAGKAAAADSGLGTPPSGPHLVDSSEASMADTARHDALDDTPILLEEPQIKRNTSPMASAPTTAMPAVQEEPRAVAPPRQVNAPREAEHGPTAQVGSSARSEPAPPARSSMASIVGLLAVLLLAGGIVLWVKMKGGTTAKVTTTVATPREVVRLYDGTATVRKSEGQTLAFGEAGKVSDIIAAGTEAKPGMPLATLESYTTVEKSLADVKDRFAFYEKQLATAKTKGDENAIKNAEAKVAEKKKLMTELEARAVKVRLVAPNAGTVAQVMVQAGGDAKAGEAVLKLADKHASAEFKVGSEAATTLRPGQAVSVQPAGGGAPAQARVAKAEGDSVVVELPEDAPLKTGDAVRLVKARVADVVPVPVSAIVKREGGDVVFVLSDGAVHERKVTVVDKSGSDALVSSGLTSGDQVVVSSPETLKDGQKATQ